MWSISRNRSLGSLSARRFILFASAILVALFATFTLFISAAQAQVTEEGAITWSDETLTYSGRTLERYDTPQSGGDWPNLAGTPCENNGPIFYSSLYPSALYQRSDPAYQEDRYWLHVICLDDESDGSDRSQPINATLIDYSVLKEGVDLDSFGWGQLDGRITYSIQVLPTESATSGASSTSCNSEHTRGIGWIICPMTNWIASAMDALYKILEGFLEVGPLSTGRDSALYYVWGVMRNFANILFIVGFLIIIYSQITNIGLSNYGIKSLLPRIIIAAVLVNISYWVAAVAVDVSNILGVTLQDLFVEIRKNMPISENINMQLEDITWEAISGAILSGTVSGVMLGGAVFGAFASAGASIYLLIPVIMGVIVSALVAILVLAARQALITVLIVISPLAFAAYLLPSTEKYFDRWRSLLTTLLMVFPIFALVFGGAQLAGMVIISSALDNPDSRNFFNVIILGMAVQVAPLIITPLLVKLSGSLIGRIAGIVNDPNRGIVDQSRNFAQSRHDMHKFSQISKKNKDGEYVHNNPLARTARWKAIRDKDREEKLTTYKSGVDAAYRGSSRSHEAHRQGALNEIQKSTGESDAKTEFEQGIAGNITLQRLYTQQQVSKGEAELAESRNKTMVDEMKTKPSMADVAIRDLAARVHDNSVDTLDETQRQSSLTQEYDSQYWKELASNTDRQAYAGAAGIADHGQTRVANIARQKQTEEREKRISAAISNLSTAEAKLSEERAVILGDAANAGQFAELAQDMDSRSGALRRYIERAPIKDLQTLHAELDITLTANGNPEAELLRSELAAAFKKRKPFYVSQTILNKIEEGTLETRFGGAPGRHLMVGEALNARALGAQGMVTGDRDDLAAAVQYLRDGGTLTADAKSELIDELNIAFTDARYKSQMEKRIKELSELRAELGMPPPRA